MKGFKLPLGTDEGLALKTRIGQFIMAAVVGCFLMQIGPGASASEFAAVGEMGEARAGAQLVLLPGGDLLIFGGSESDEAGGYRVEEFDPETRTFEPGGLIPAPGLGIPSIGGLPDGRVLAAGGSTWTEDEYGDFEIDRDVRSTGIYDPATETFTPGPDMSAYRDGATLVSLDDGRMLIAGGINDYGETEPPTSQTTFEIFSPGSNSFIGSGMLAGRRASTRPFVLESGKVLFVAGAYLDVHDTNWGPLVGWFDDRTSELWDPSTNSSGNVTTLNEFHAQGAFTEIAGGEILAAGGYNDGLTVYEDPSATAETYDPTTNSWTVRGSLATPRAGVQAAELPDGRAIVVGGFSDTREVLSSTEIFDPVTGQFSPGPELVTARNRPDVVALKDGDILVLGGYDGEGNALASAEILDTSDIAPPPPETEPKMGRLSVVPNSKSARRGQRMTFRATVRSVGTAPLTGARVCVKAPKKLVSVKACWAAGRMAASSSKTVKFKVQVRRSAKRGKTASLVFTASAKGVTKATANAKIKVK